MQISPKNAIITLILLYIISCLPIHITGLYYYYTTSFIITALLYFFFLYNKPKSIKLIALFTLMVIASFIILFYNQFWAKIVTTLRITSLLLLTLHMYPKQKGLTLDKLDVAFLVFVLILKSIIVYIHIELISDTEFVTATQKILFYLYAFAIITSMYYSIRYYSRIKTKKALYLLLFTFSFPIGEIFNGIGYFTKYPIAYYFDRLFYISALYFLIWHILKKEKILNN